jgi:transcriptional regulator with XRE-family HTH domain
MQQHLGETIRKYRNKKGYTITQLADSLNVSTGLISNIETNKTDSFQLVLLNKIIKKLDIPICELNLFTEPYPVLKFLNNNSDDLNKIKANIETLINAFITVASSLSFEEDQIEELTTLLILELKTINKLLESAKSK